MKLHPPRPAGGARKARKRVGRARAAGKDKPAGRGTKGWGARHTPKLGFEGGQMPLQRRVPKLKGFTNPNREEFSVINVARLGQAFEAGAEVTPETLLGRGLVRRGLRVKILGGG